MASRDLKNDIRILSAFDGATIATDTTTAGNIIDTALFSSVTFVLALGAYTAGDATMLLEESDDATFTVSNVVDAQFILNDAAESLVDAANAIQTLGYVGHKRYVRMSIVSDNGADFYASGQVILEHARNNPVTQ